MTGGSLTFSGPKSMLSKTMWPCIRRWGGFWSPADAWKINWTDGHGGQQWESDTVDSFMALLDLGESLSTWWGCPKLYKIAAVCHSCCTAPRDFHKVSLGCPTVKVSFDPGPVGCMKRLSCSELGPLIANWNTIHFPSGCVPFWMGLFNIAPSDAPPEVSIRMYPPRKSTFSVVV